MFTVAKFALLAIGEEHARNCGRIVKHLQLVERVVDAFRVVIPSICLEERLVLGIQHGLFTIVWIIPIHLTVSLTLDDRSEELEDVLFDLFEGEVALDDHDSRLRQLQLLLEHVVAGALLGHHELYGHVIANVSSCLLTLKRH